MAMLTTGMAKAQAAADAAMLRSTTYPRPITISEGIEVGDKGAA